MENQSSYRRICVRLCFIPQRYLVAVMLALGIMTAFTIRVSFGIVLRYIVKPTNVTKISKTENICNFTIESHRKVQGIYDWNSKVNTDTWNAFFYGYMIGHIPGGYMADKFGGKHVFGLAVLFSGLLTLIIPNVIKLIEKPFSIVVIRFLIGTVQGAIFPAANTMISHWTPLRDRGKVAGIVFSASQFSSFFNNMYTTTIVEIDWTYVFYIYGAIAVGWWMIWCLLCYSDPIKNPFIGDKEWRYLKKGLAGHIVFDKKNIPWVKIMTSHAVWSFIVVQLGHTWIWHSMIRDLPTYMMEILKYDMHSSHLVTSLPYGIMGITTLTLGFISDVIIRRRFMTVDTVRKIFSTVGAMGPGIFTLGASFAGCNRELSVVMFSLGMGQMSFYYAGTRPLALDLSPNFSGFIMGVVNGIGAIPGFVQSDISKKITAHNTLHEWRLLFLLSLGILAVTNIFFVMFGTAKEQPWNSVTRKPKMTPKRDET